MIECAHPLGLLLTFVFGVFAGSSASAEHQQARQPPKGKAAVGGRALPIEDSSSWQEFTRRRLACLPLQGEVLAWFTSCGLHLFSASRLSFLLRPLLRPGAASCGSQLLSVSCCSLLVRPLLWSGQASSSSCGGCEAPRTSLWRGALAFLGLC